MSALGSIPEGQARFALRGRNPDVLTCIANLSNDEVFTPPEFANRMLDTLAEAWAADHNGASIWADKTVRFLDPCTKSGQFRTVGVAVVRGDGLVMHRGSPAEQVPALVEQLLHWGKTSEAHPLIKSSAVHYMLEHIHPFRDGNGRIGRLWQTLILSRWNPLFAWMPVETLVHHNQALYYKALQESHAGAVDCRPFIGFMLDAIGNSLYKYIDVATETMNTAPGDVGANVGVSDKILELLAQQPHLSARELAALLNKATRTVERHLKTLREQGRLKRVGSDKTGHWVVIEKPQ